ncbi:hypothetical protein SKAU_G00099350 [Synaphobranchus kaupii]|uniref:Letm1 RBD domain-containing protein n=1 Tax=Synaphobranchus kaupii TaxID=118154 RepID=A0A9Q1FYU0_SYNKA|nr:hypothetical protein SKAU_G00099350 [Synaphobranchus kaupii]
MCVEGLTDVFIGAANRAIPVRRGKGVRRAVPWWTDECSEAVRARNQAFRALRVSMTQQAVLEYQRLRAIVRRTIKRTKRAAWRRLCSTFGRETCMNDVWRIVKKMRGCGGMRRVPVLVDGDLVARTDGEKANMLAKTLSGEAGGVRLSAECLRQRREVLEERRDLGHKKMVFDSVLDVEFTMLELTLAVKRAAAEQIPRTEMALSLAGACRGSALVFLCGRRSNGVTTSICTPMLASSRISLTIYRLYSPSKARLGLRSHVVSRLKWVNEKYEGFLKRRFPRFYILYHTFMTGFRLLLRDAMEVRKIKLKMYYSNMKVHELPYRDMEKLRVFRRDLIKAIPLMLICIPPFANYLVFVLMYFFPRQILIRHFWTPEKQVEYQGVYHARRSQHYAGVLKGLVRAVPHVKNQRQQSQLLDLCDKVVQNRLHPSVTGIQAVRALFSGPPLGMKRLDTNHMRLLSSQLFLTPRLPAFLIRQRLNGHAIELLQLDRALNSLGVLQLSETELREACYMRGLHDPSLSAKQCREWLMQWLQLTSRLKESEVSLLLHSMVLLSVNYHKPFHH